jgi:Protein of unknown function (DUF4242)
MSKTLRWLPPTESAKTREILAGTECYAGPCTEVPEKTGFTASLMPFSRYPLPMGLEREPDHRANPGCGARGGASLRSIEALELTPDVRWIRSYYSAEEGKIYCEYQAPSVEAIIEHARNAGIPFDRAEVVRVLEPRMFA